MTVASSKHAQHVAYSNRYLYTRQNTKSNITWK